MDHHSLDECEEEEEREAKVQERTLLHLTRMNLLLNNRVPDNEAHSPRPRENEGFWGVPRTITGTGSREEDHASKKASSSLSWLKWSAAGAAAALIVGGRYLLLPQSK